MKKRMMLLAVGAVAFAGAAQDVFAEEEVGGIKKITEMIAEAQEVTQGTVVVSTSMTLGSVEYSAGTTVSMMPDQASVDMLYLSVPNDDGTSFDLVSEDVLRIFGAKAYLNSGLVNDIASALEEENRLDDSENALEAVDSLSEDWIGLTGIEVENETYEGWGKLFSGFAAAHDAGSYTINLGNDQIREVLARLDEQIETNTDFVSSLDLEDLLTPYFDAISEGMEEAKNASESEKGTSEDKTNESEADEEIETATDFEKSLSEFADEKTESFAEQFDKAVSKGLVVNASICAGKDGAAGTYAFELTIEANIPKELQEEWGIDDLEPLIGESEGLEADLDEEETKNAIISFVVSIEPSEEPIEIEEPDENVLWLTDLLKEWAAQGLF